MYIRGLHVAQSTEKALYWFELAAAQGVEAAKGYIQRLKSEAVVNDNKALFDEALALYQAGRLSEALERFTALAEQGHTMAQYIVGNMYDFGESVPKNFETAFIWYKKAAEQGHPDAQYNLGCFYADGKGTKRDYEKAIEWFRKAADSGNKDAQREVITLSRELSRLYQDVAFQAMDAQRISEALYFLEKSGKYGNSNAYYNLAVLYAQGKVVKQDIEKAKHFSKQAMAMGNMRAKQLYDMLSGM
jgi:TPR repeat protein